MIESVDSFLMKEMLHEDHMDFVLEDIDLQPLWNLLDDETPMRESLFYTQEELLKDHDEEEDYNG